MMIPIVSVRLMVMSGVRDSSFIIPLSFLKDNLFPIS